MAASGILLQHYNPAFAGLSAAIAILASAVSLDVASRLRGVTGWMRGLWVTLSGIAMGGGIWAMHFIGMLALSLPIPVFYSLRLILLSLAFAIVLSSTAFLIISRGEITRQRLLTAGSVMGLAAVVMHATGVAAMQLSAAITYQPWPVLASMLIAVSCATIGLAIAMTMTGTRWRITAAVVMGLGIFAMQYTVMAGTSFAAGPSPNGPAPGGIDRTTLALLVAIGIVALLCVALLSATFDRRFASMHARETAESRGAALRAEAALAELRDTQQSLVQAEKMASLSQLTAGIAHEINTPIGTTLTAATSLQRRTEEFLHSVEAGTVTKAAALRYAGVAAETTDLIVSNVIRAAELIQSFKLVAVDQTSGECREFELKPYLKEVVHSLSPRLKHPAHVVTVECPPMVRVMTYPGALAQIVSNLVLNSVVHAYPDGRAGNILVRARLLDHDTVELTYTDDGCGIPESDIGRIYDPFFTTRRSAGGTGLGMHIVYNIVTQTLKGSINVASSSDGVCFTMRFPSRIITTNQAVAAA